MTGYFPYKLSVKLFSQY